MNEYYNLYDETRKITLKHIFTKWFKFIRLMIILAIITFLYQMFGSDVTKCKIVDVNEKSGIAKCESEIIQFDNDKYKGDIVLDVGDSVNIHIGKVSEEVRKVKLNFDFLEE